MVFPIREAQPQPPFGTATCQRLIHATLTTEVRNAAPRVRD